MAEDGNGKPKSPEELSEEVNRNNMTEHKTEPLSDWRKIIVTAIVTFVVTSLVSFAGTYYTHGVALATVQQRLTAAEEKIKAIEGKTPAVPTPVSTVTSVVSPPPNGEPKAKIEITNLTNNAEVDVTSSGNAGELACFYMVRGTSANVVSNDKLQWYILVRPKADNVWYIQKDDSTMNEATGEWEIKAWLGDIKIAPKKGEIFDVAAVVTEPSRVEGKTKVGKLDELQPKDKSIVTGLRVGNIQ
jgi:hypothetical protein